MKENELFVEKLTLQNKDMQRSKLRMFSKLTLDDKLKVLEMQKSKFHILKQNHQEISNSLLTYCSLIISINEFVNIEDELNLLAKELHEKKNLKSHPKRNKLISHWAEIRRLKLDESLSFRDICSYLQSKRKLKVAVSTLYGLWIEIEKKGEENVK